MTSVSQRHNFHVDLSNQFLKMVKLSKGNYPLSTHKKLNKGINGEKSSMHFVVFKSIQNSQRCFEFSTIEVSRFFRIHQVSPKQKSVPLTRSNAQKKNLLSFFHITLRSNDITKREVKRKFDLLIKSDIERMGKGKYEINNSKEWNMAVSKRKKMDAVEIEFILRETYHYKRNVH